MRVEWSTEPGDPDRPNEDYLATSPTGIVLLDGAGTPPEMDSGCKHGVPWYVQRLGLALLSQMHNLDNELSDCLAEAIGDVADEHADTCDLDHPGSPSSTVDAIRLRGDLLDHLVLADSTLVIEPMSEADQQPMRVITDDREGRIGRHLRHRMDALPVGSTEHSAALADYVTRLRHYRNREGGFWVASCNPAAAHHSITGITPIEQVKTTMLLTDGATRLMDRFYLVTWQEALDQVAKNGPHVLIRQTRAAEFGDPEGDRWPRGKRHDDATVVYISTRTP